MAGDRNAGREWVEVLGVDEPISVILATSREWLDIDVEQVFQLRSLDTSDAGSSAVQLFVQRARATDPNFAADADGAVALITSTISPRSPGTHLAMYLLAARLGIGDEVHELRRAEGPVPPGRDASPTSLNMPQSRNRPTVETGDIGPPQQRLSRSPLRDPKPSSVR